MWAVFAILILYFVYKEWPDFKARVSKGPLKDQRDSADARTVEERLGSIESEIKQVNQKLDRDYYRINDLEVKLRKTRESQANVNQELEIIMRALVGVLKGLQEQGANGPTRKAQEEIENYLNQKAHDINQEE